MAKRTRKEISERNGRGTVNALYFFSLRRMKSHDILVPRAACPSYPAGALHEEKVGMETHDLIGSREDEG